MTAPATLTLRRDYHAGTRDLPGMDLGAASLDADVDELFRSGARRATLDGVVDLVGAPDPGVARALGLVRDLTAWGMVVDWTVRLPEGMALPLALGHLFPPARVVGPNQNPEARNSEARNSEAQGDEAQGDEIADLWRRKFTFARCFWRAGPGFAEIRDRRSARPRRLVVDDPVLLAAIPRLAEGMTIAAMNPAVREWLRGSGLGLRLGDHFWWAPYRIRRWPSPPLAV